MYRIQASTLSVASHFPRGLTTLGIAWMHGQFDAVALHKGEILGTWRAPEPIEDLALFADLLRRAAQETKYDGTSIHLVLAHSRLAHQLVEVPDASGAALQPLVRRQVERLNIFEDAAAWAFEKAEPAKTSSSALVHLFPQSLLDKLTAAAEEAGFHLASALPPTSILHAQLTRLPLEKSHLALLVADFGGHTTVVVGRRESPLFLARSIDGAKARGTSGLAVELNRTLLYVSQQFGTAVTGVWLFGTDMAPKVEELRPLLKIPVEPSPEEASPSYWAEEVLRVPAEFSTNLISAQQVRAPQRKALVKVTTLLTAAILIICLASAAWFQFRYRQETRLAADLQTQVVQYQSQHRDLQGAYLQLTQRERFVRQILDDRPSPVPIWFLAYLGEITPPELAITNLHISRTTNAWHVRIDGRTQPSSQTNSQDLRRGVDELSARLQSGPFQAQLLTNNAASTAHAQATRRSAADAFADWAAQIRPAAPKPAAPTGPSQFHLEALFL